MAGENPEAGRPVGGSGPGLGGWRTGFAGREERVGRLEGVVGRILRAQVGNFDLCLIPWATVSILVPDLLLMRCSWMGEVADFGGLWLDLTHDVFSLGSSAL